MNQKQIKFIKFANSQKRDMSRILAIDVGQKRIGLAVTDPLQIIASPLETIHVKDIFEYLTNYCKNEEVEAFVIGDARTLKNKASDSNRFIVPFINRVKKLFPTIKIERMDERFTSVIAKQTIIDAGIKKKGRQDKSLTDKISATLILQSFLQTKNRIL